MPIKRRPNESATDCLFRLSRRSPKQVLIDDGRWLAEWLNDWPEHEGDKARIKVLLDRLQKLDSVVRSARGTSTWKVPEIKQLEADLEKLTRHYISWPRYAANLDCSGLGVAHVWLRGPLEESQAREVLERL